MFRKLISLITLLVMLSPMVYARKSASEQVSELDYSRKLWLEYPGIDSNAYFQYDKSNSEIDCPAKVNFSGVFGASYTTDAGYFNITTSSSGASARGILRVINTQDPVLRQHYLLELWHNDEASANADYIVCKDSSAGTAIFKIIENGSIEMKNGETIINTTDGTIGFTDGTNSLVTIVDGGTTGVLNVAHVAVTTVTATYIGISGDNITDFNGADLSVTAGVLEVDDSYLRNDADDATSYNITATTLTPTYIVISGDNITDFNGADLSVTAGVLEVDDSYLRNDADDSTIYNITATTITPTYIVISGDNITDFNGADLSVTAGVLAVDDSFLQNDVDDDNGTYKLTLGSCTVTNTLTADNVILSGNILKASDGGNTITLDVSDNVAIAGDLTVTGDKITCGTNGAVIDNETLATELNITETNIMITGGFGIDSFVTITDSDTVTTSSGTYLICSKNTAQEIDLPDAATSQGKIFCVKKTGASGHVTTIDANGGTIDGADPYTEVDTQYDFVVIISDGTNWHIVGKYITP